LLRGRLRPARRVPRAPPERPGRGLLRPRRTGRAGARRRDIGRGRVQADMSTAPSLAGRLVGVTADRRWRAQADLLGNLGAKVVHGPTLRTVDLSGDEALRR